LSLGSLLWAVIAFCTAVFLGPDWFILLGKLGIILSTFSLMVGLPKKSPFGHSGVAVLALVLNGGLVLIGMVLDSYLVHPFSLPDMPALSTFYEDPSHAFRIKIPSGWMPEPESHGDLGTSIHLRPSLANRTPGIGQIDILVKPQQQSKENLHQAFKGLMRWMKVVISQKQEKDAGDLKISPERVTLSNGTTGLYVKIEGNRGWIPLREDVLCAAKPGRFLCMIAGSGLAAYVEAYHPLFEKLYESIEVSNFQTQ